MTTLLAVYNSERCVGRCDANCYEAKTMRCSCICGGRNHGVGRDRVSTEMDESKIAAFQAQRPELRDERLVVINRCVVPDSRDAREMAWMRLNQLELSFDARADV